MYVNYKASNGVLLNSHTLSLAYVEKWTKLLAPWPIGSSNFSLVTVWISQAYAIVDCSSIWLQYVKKSLIISDFPIWVLEALFIPVLIKSRSVAQRRLPGTIISNKKRELLEIRYLQSNVIEEPKDQLISAWWCLITPLQAHSWGYLFPNISPTVCFDCMKNARISTSNIDNIRMSYRFEVLVPKSIWLGRRLINFCEKFRRRKGA